MIYEKIYCLSLALIQFSSVIFLSRHTSIYIVYLLSLIIVLFPPLFLPNCFLVSKTHFRMKKFHLGNESKSSGGKENLKSL